MAIKMFAFSLIAVVSATGYFATQHKIEKHTAEYSAIKTLTRFDYNAEQLRIAEAFLNKKSNYWDIAVKDSNSTIYFCSVNAVSGRTYYITSTKKVSRLKNLDRDKKSDSLSEARARKMLEKFFSRIDQPYTMRFDEFKFSLDKKVGNDFVPGKTSGAWNAYFHGYRFIDRKVRIAITLDSLDGDLLTYLENLSTPARSEPIVTLSESEARSKVQSRLGAEGARRAEFELGWYVPRGEAKARLGYAFFTPGKLPRRIIDARSGILTEINIAVK